MQGDDEGGSLRRPSAYCVLGAGGGGSGGRRGRSLKASGQDLGDDGTVTGGVFAPAKDAFLVYVLAYISNSVWYQGVVMRMMLM